ncbi:diamine acetyltransferase 2b isoform X2 [Chaetodon auriga]|uniref:diamine acetyltransferase 2b isoform X2 n=1 Tax=Chaetodon auriga TaxID=39042 RepID=UPI004032D016
MNFKIRPATKEDCKEISRMILELAVYENMTDQVKISHEELERDGFCENPFFECLVAEVPEEHKSKDGFTIVGYALYFYTYSTWKGRSVYLEDLYVMPEFRGNGIGKGLLSSVAQGNRSSVCGCSCLCSTGILPLETSTLLKELRTSPSARAGTLYDLTDKTWTI